MSYSMTSILGCVRSLRRSWNHIGLIRELSTGLGVTESVGRGAMRKPALRSGVLVSVGVRGKMQLLGASLALLVFCLPIFSQVNTGRILGTVADQTGGVIAGASVALTNVDTGVARNLTTDTAGEYNAPNLPPGNYAVHATAMGFQALDRRGVVVQIGTDVRIDVQLVPGQITQTVEVTESIPLLDTTSATIGGTLNTQTIADLPMNGRNYQRLLILQPGQFQRAGGGTDTQESNGLRAEDSNYYVEGLDNNEPFYGQSVVNSSLPSGDAATILPIDAIQEFNVENNPPAEFGRKAGAVVNVGLKSGTNSIHGSAYAFGRDDAMDARNFFNPPPQPVAPLNFEQWGVTVGGPIKKDKLFYYAGFERQTYTVGNSFTASLPSTADFTANGVPDGAKFSIPDAKAALTGLFPISPLSTSLLPLYGANGALTNNVPSGFPDVISIYNVLGKADYHPNDHHTINGSYFRGHGDSLSQDSNNFTSAKFLTLATLLTQFVTTSWTWTPNSAWVNELRGGWTYYDETMFVADHNVAPTTYGLNTGVTDPLLFGFPNVSVAGLTGLGGGSHWPQVHGASTGYDLVDAVSYLHGKHAFKFGADVFTFNSPNFFDAAGRGSFSFNAGTLFPGSTGLEAFLAGVPTLGKLEVGSPVRVMNQWMYSVFAEDVWRATKRVTVNLGLRWEYDAPVTEAANLIGNWTPAAGFQQAGINSVNGKAVYNPDHKDFSPRIGLAWDVNGKGTTVVRAGYGIYYTTPPLSPLIGNPGLSNAPTTGINSIPTAFSIVVPSSPASPVLGTVQPALKNGTIAAAGVTYPGSALTWVPAPGGPIFPATGTSGSAFECGNGIGANPTPCPILAVNTNLVNPIISMWNLGVQHSFTSNLSVEATYVGNHSKQLPSIIDINQAPPGSETAASCPFAGNTAAFLQIARPYFTQYPYISNINYLTNLDTSNYNALQATVTERNYHNLSLLIGYTYSHALDDQSHYFGGALPQNSFAPYAEYGSSDFDLRHHLTIAITYAIPGRKGFGQILEGWSLNSLVALQSGLPWNVADGSDDISATGEFADRWNFYGNPKDFTANLNPIPFFPGGSATMPAACTSNAAAAGATANLAQFGCYAEGGSAMIPPASGTFGTMGRNIFRDSGYRAWDLSVFKTFKFKERLTAQFRAEFFNILNRPNFANPGLNGTTDPSGGAFGAENSTPDVAAANPVLGTGGPREIQLGLKLLF